MLMIFLTFNLFLRSILAYMELLWLLKAITLVMTLVTWFGLTSGHQLGCHGHVIWLWSSLKCQNIPIVSPY